MLLGRRAFNIAQAMTDFIELSGIVAVVDDDDNDFFCLFLLCLETKNINCVNVQTFVLMWVHKDKEARARHQASSVSLCLFFSFFFSFLP